MLLIASRHCGSRYEGGSNPLIRSHSDICLPDIAVSNFRIGLIRLSFASRAAHSMIWPDWHTALGHFAAIRLALQRMVEAKTGLRW